MFMTRTMAASLGWRAFAVLVTVSAGPMFTTGLGVDGSSVARNSFVGLIALAGLLGYAYGFRIGPLIFWRLFGVVFAVGLMIRAGSDLGPTALAVAQGRVAPGSAKVVAAGILFATMMLLCLALFRHAQLVGPKSSSKSRNDELVDVFA